MRRTIILAGLAACVMAAWFLSTRSRSAREGSSTVLASGTRQVASNRHLPEAGEQIHGELAAFPGRGERSRMSDKERLRWLEQLGHVPEDADRKDWKLATETSWWGKPLDPQEFWKGKVVWFDEVAKAEAARHGRTYPPIPYDAATLARLNPALMRAYPDEGATSWGQAGPDTDGGTRGTAITSRESAFWVWFARTYPHPPEDIERTQVQVEEIALRHQGNILEHEKQERISWGYPPEALSEEALFWGYVVNRRREYKALLDAGNPPDSVQIEVFRRTLLVDPAYVTGSLTEEQVRTADSWKSAYLQRLRREQTTEPYIGAYLRAWNLSSDQVFGEGGR